MPIREKTFWLDTVEMSATPAAASAGARGRSRNRRRLYRVVRGKNARKARRQSCRPGIPNRRLGSELAKRRDGPDGIETQRHDFDLALRKRDGAPYVRRFPEIHRLRRAIVREEKIDCDFSRCGHLEVACKARHFDYFQREAEVIAREFGHALHVVPKNELPSEIGSLVYHGGLVDETSAGLNPARYVAGLARAAERAGAAIVENTRVEKIEREASHSAQGWSITTFRGTLWAREVFVATSGYTSGVTPSLQKKIVPIGSYIIVTEPLPEKLATQVSPRNRMLYDSKNYLYYYRLTPDRRMLFGGRAAFFPETENTIRSSAAKFCGAA